MNIKILEDNHLTPAEGEVAVKTYHCTALDPIFAWFGMKINGYISVTNKRLLYYAFGSSGYGAAGNSRSCVAVWLADACNITQEIGTRFSLLRLILAGGVIFVIGSATNLGTTVFLKLAFPQMDIGPMTIRLLTLVKISVAAIITARTFSIPHEKISRVALVAVVAGLTANLHLALTWGVFVGMIPVPYLWFGFLLDVAVTLYSLWCLYWFIRREYIHIKVVGKNANNQYPPIDISANSFWSRINVISSWAANMAPAPGADAMFKELGAIIADIQTLGDHGIKKWSQKATEARTGQEVVASNLAARRPLVLRYAVGFIVLVAVLITTEFSITSYNQHQAELREAANTVKQQVDNAKINANIDQFTQNIVPQMVSKAEQEQSAGETAFNNKEYSQASEHWKLAADQFSQIPDVVKPFRDAEELKEQHDIQLQILISIALNREQKSGEPSSDDIAQLNSYLESHAPEEWILVKDAIRKAEAFKTAGQGTDYLNQWNQVTTLTAAVMKKVRAAVSVQLP